MKLEINCGMCDATRLTEEKVSMYDSLELNCGTLLVTPSSNRVLTGLGAELNAGRNICVPDGGRVTVRTGNFTVAAPKREGPTEVEESGEDVTDAEIPAREEPGDVLIVTGQLCIESDAVEEASRFAAIYVTGNLVCPKSFSGRAEVTGTETVYPDGYIYMGEMLKIDKLARLRFAGKKLYADTVRLTDQVTPEEIVEAGMSLACEKAVIPEAWLKRALPLFDESPMAEIQALPDGAVYLTGRLELDKSLLRRGNRLWIDGDLNIATFSAPLLKRLEYIHVTGRVTLPEEYEEEYLALDPECGELDVLRGIRISDRDDDVRIDQVLVGREGFVEVERCGRVIIDPALTHAQIETGITVRDCDRVICSPEQAPTLWRVCRNVEHIGPDMPREEVVRPQLRQKEPDTFRIDCGMYTF